MKKIGFVLLACAGLAAAQELAEIRRVLDEAVTAGQLPGAVCLVSHQGRIVHQSVHGSRALVPAVEPMTADTIFDAASLTKVVATTASIMKLVEQGRIRLNDKVTTYLPAYQGGKSDITVRLLLTHFSGLRPDLDLKPEWSGYELGIRKALVDKPVNAPGERFVYSDINFILLGEIVRQVSGRPLDQYAQEEIFQPLGMKDSHFFLPEAKKDRLAIVYKKTATGLERADGTILGGLSAAARPQAIYPAPEFGMYSTAEDLAKFYQALLRGDRRILSKASIRLMSSKQTGDLRAGHMPHTVFGLTWEVIDDPRGEVHLLSKGTYGHGGAFSTHGWVDPARQTVGVFLTQLTGAPAEAKYAYMQMVNAALID